MEDSDYMSIALKLAVKGMGYVNPNPMVGAVIVKEDRVIGAGYHEKYGGFHAEINALRSCTESPKGSVIYVTLEPCCHYGKTPPCTEAIVKSGISKVVIGSNDPNPLVKGRSILYLKEHRIEVVQGVLKEQCDEINKPFFHYISTSTPYIMMKYAMTMDGKIACYTGKSKWISGEEARLDVQNDRKRYSAIMVGVNTIINDDSLLTFREKKELNPIRIICDTQLRTPITSKVITTAKDIKTIIATCCLEKQKHKKYIDCGCKILCISKKDNKVNLKELINKLGALGIDSIILEGGSELNFSALKAGIVQKVKVYIAPKIFGGDKAKSPVGGVGIELPAEAFYINNKKVKSMGNDILVEGELI
ncbi:MAG: bifunctional diaminohydroxyphosphoribosylaminopyrimidine deaminase/5-amino-6-(5-phosphoribosylamino)uracil reductase RibD [Inconstantimicrobium porci]|uniref:bifunctional diaminohydroxyphosphoribosylaminopyrimidine deaminase/5-amino-6-(5-phosphoribosylamino)uracil reductase RibD n=1 Tax=Inconstantimicrobium porci TaxID=2652291 RepID=UPI0024098D65|nr:bifunctional diaminohydroxyphosphoribosylaminopyrimidine deaminase/5-amino-6-(5-phosphoribosylamino)uracil reductase RibD [Inconstantimicrobium porci]MDD6771701.1 bifunctional diaminohydroxyphosphoribosylaminopyrimidine deaminase/5-amino-6-(5-phosphoribosylamino)uracil reductase RibD [Inconstantimicrobium porci]MDY5912189.1 bifunctional diaminohydroxyphosphoribosylaminopyrimidine deaminase/5-amino-6-(5-phosphoribosylamino)uracil reductase RibD [Inconstantimicrobium porci]